MKQHVKSIEVLDKTLKISWQVTLWCNYNCSYCAQRNRRKTVSEELDNKLYTPYAKVCEIADKLNGYIEKAQAQSIRLQLIGGEVTYYDLVDLLSKHLTSPKIKVIDIVTNLSRESNWWDVLVLYSKVRELKLNLTASYHPEQVPNKQEFIDKAVKYATLVTAVLTPDNYIELNKFCEDLRAAGYTRPIKLVNDRWDDSTVDNTFIEQVRERWTPDKAESFPGFLVTYDNGASEQLTQPELQKLFGSTRPVFTGWECTANPRVTYYGRIKTGVCNPAGEQDQSLDASITAAHICTQESCALCQFIKIERK